MSRTIARRAEKSRSLSRRLLAGATTVFLALGMTVGGAGAALADQPDQNDKTNNVEHWEALYPGSKCTKFGDTVQAYDFGSVVVGDDGKTAVMLNVSAPGTLWQVLIVKGGSVNYGDGPGNKVYPSPSAGILYYAPLNDSGEVANVSHWIVCSGPTGSEPDPVAPAFTSADERCDRGVTLVGGSISLNTRDGAIRYDVYRVLDGDDDLVAPEDLTDLAPGDYLVVPFATGDAPLDDEGFIGAVTINAYIGDCPTDSEPDAVVPAFTPTNERCDRGVTLVGGSISLNTRDGAIRYDVYRVLDGGNVLVAPADLTDLASGDYLVVPFATGDAPLDDEGFIGAVTINAYDGVCEQFPDLPITNVLLAFTTPTCEVGQQLDSKNFTLDPGLAELTSSDVDKDGNYVVVFAAVGEKTVFNQNEDVFLLGRTVSPSGKTLTFHGKLAGPDTQECIQLLIVGPFDYTDSCLLGASYTLKFVEGLSYFVSVNGGKAKLIDSQGLLSRTFTAQPGDTVSAVPVAHSKYMLAEDQPTPLSRTFVVYGPLDCQLTDLPNWPASVSSMNQVCATPGTTSGVITIQRSIGSETNPNPVRYYLAFGTPQQVELMSATTAVAPGTYVVTAQANLSTDSVNNSGRTVVFAPLTVGAAGSNCGGLPTLALTGAGDITNWLGVAAVMMMIAGMGFVVRRNRVEV